MLFSVVGCPDCKRAQVVDGAAARAHCRGCAKSYELADRKRFYTGEDAEEARRVAAKVSLAAQGASIEAIAEATAALERERTQSLEDVLEALRRMPEFTVADVEDALLRARLRTTGVRVVESLRRSDRLYEPRPGRYRWVA